MEGLILVVDDDATIAPELRGGMVENVLREMRDRCLNLPSDRQPDVRAWLRELTGGQPRGS